MNEELDEDGEVERGLLMAYLLGPDARKLGPGEVLTWKREYGPLWAHFDISCPEGRMWIEERLELPETAREELLAEETRPRVVIARDGLLVNLRGVNLNPGADPEDMVAVRVWCTPDLIITSRQRRLMATEDVAAVLLEEDGPRTPGSILANLSTRLVDRMQPVLESIEMELDELEEDELLGEYQPIRARLAEVRRELIQLRRHIAPQKDVMFKLSALQLAWIPPEAHTDLLQCTDDVTRYVEDLDQLGERGRVLQEQLVHHLTMEMNKRMFIFSLVAVIFLPLSLLTGLLGINVGGIPGATHDYAFLVVCGVMLCVGALQVWFLRRIGWI